MRGASAALAGLALLSVLAVPGWGVPVDAKEVREQSTPGEQELNAAIAEAVERLRADDCQGALARLDELVEPAGEGDRRVAIQLLRMPCLGQVGRIDDLVAVQQELSVSAPGNGLVQAYGVLASLYGERREEAGERLAALAEQNPGSLDALSGNALRGINQKLGEAERYDLIDRISIALGRAGWQPGDLPELYETIAAGATDALLARNATDEARLYLSRISDPGILFEMAINRHYQPLWPDIERRLGPESGTAIDRHALDRLEAFTRNPADDRALEEAARAYILLGRYPEAIEIAQRVTIAKGMSEEQIAVARYHAYALAATGGRDAGSAVLMPFASLDPATTFALATGLVGLSEMLDEAGRREEALRIARDSLTRAADQLSPYGQGWLRRTEICALAGLDRRAEAMPLSDTIEAASADNEAAAIEALLCLGEDDRAATIAIATLATKEGAAALADQFQPDGAIGSPTPSYLRELWQTFLKRPDVRAAFDARLRILPPALWPSSEPRPIPRANVPDGMPVA